MDDDRLDSAAGDAAPALGRAAAELRALDAAAAGVASSVGGGLARALERAVRGSASLGGALRGLAADLARSALRAAVRPVGQAAGAALGGAAAEVAGGLLGAVKGFARGGVIDRPTNVGAGIAGEAGPEAILPLARGADGRLGVRGGGVTVTLNVSTPDVDGFRRSESQIAAALARAVARGQRRL
jgi:phage-related minor tail protein